MKIHQLTEGEPLEIIEVLANYDIPAYKTTTAIKQIQTRVVTDGEIINEDEEELISIKELYIGKKKYQEKVDTIKSKKIYIRNHTYVITYLLIKNKGDYHIKGISIYLANHKDKKALKEAKWIINIITRNPRWINLYELQTTPKVEAPTNTNNAKEKRLILNK